MQPEPCDQIALRLAEVLDEQLAGDGLPALREHAADCAPCSALLAEQLRMLAELRSGARVPTGAFEIPLPDVSSCFRSVPAVAAHRGRTPLRIGRPIAAAALVLASVTLAASLWFFRTGSEPARSTSSVQSPVTDASYGVRGTPVIIESIASLRVGIGIPDERLLRHSSGCDAMASLRPALDQ